MIYLFLSKLKDKSILNTSNNHCFYKILRYIFMNQSILYFLSEKLIPLYLIKINGLNL
ncbi:hypothetical protein BAMY6639_10715 [Bacillus amyloliquefaciens UMAF6639]|nr:hypothetical protein BAMY6639_10715 [Bacillus amyloliquefaciens UMAF6639]